MKVLQKNASIDETHFKAMAEHACISGSITGPKVLPPSDIEAIDRLEKLGDETGVHTLREWEKEM